MAREVCYIVFEKGKMPESRKFDGKNQIEARPLGQSPEAPWIELSRLLQGGWAWENPGQVLESGEWVFTK